MTTDTSSALVGQQSCKAAKLRGKARLWLQPQFGKLHALSGYSVTKCGNTCRFGALAQSVEHRTFNPLVLGSSPRGPIGSGFFFTIKEDVK